MLILFWIYKSRMNKSGQAPIMMRITINTDRVSFSTNHFIEPKQWDKDKQRIKGNAPLIKEINNTLLNFTTTAWNYYNECIKKHIPVKPEGVRDAILNKDKPTATLIEAFTYQIKNLKSRVGFDVAINTVKKYETAERKIKQFLKETMNRADIYLHELNHKFVTELDLYMRTKEGLKHNAIIKNMQQCKRVIKICMDSGWLEKDPFTNYNFKLNDTERGYLTAQELTLIEEVMLPNNRLEQVRDVFIFCCYTGLAYADVTKLHSAHIEKDGNGIEWIKINRTKTTTKSVIPILPKAKAILNKYSGTFGISKEKLLPVISNQNLNKYIKEVAALCAVKKRVSMHLARHTFATTVTLEKGVDIITVSKMLGHKNVRTTQVYSKVTELKIAADMKKIM